MIAPMASWAWIPIVIAAALAQTARNAAQRALVAQAGTLGATLARFLYGVPFALAWVLLHAWPATASAVPRFGAGYFFWLVLGALGQLAATACMLLAMKQRNFVVGVAFSKTDALQVALFGTLFLAELPGWMTMLAMGLATAGVVMLSLPPKGAATGGVRSWTSGAALYGLASGAGFAISAVGYRGAALQLPEVPAWLVSGWGVLLAQSFQTLLLGGWLALKAPASLKATLTAWRVSITAGAMGALASIGWFTGFALTSAANVRTLGMVEVVFSLVVSHRFMQERLSRLEQAGLVLVVAGLAVLVL
jgi:drug/metabolite transporter (DMT)-like permease